MIRSVRCCVSTVAVAVVICLAGETGLRAAEPEVLFEDDFSELDASFSPNLHSKARVEDRNLVLTGEPNWGFHAVYQSVVFTDADLTVRVRLGEPDAEKNSQAGVAFWGLNYGELYAFLISDSGTVTVQKRSAARTTNPVPWHRNSAVKMNAGEWNEMRVVTAGNRATLYLNGTKIASIRGTPPEGGGVIGLLYYSGTEENMGRFANLKVVTPTGPDAVPFDEKAADPNVLFADDFATFDASWGTETGQTTVKDGQMLLKPDVDRTKLLMNGGVTLTDAELTVKVKVSDNDPDAYCSAGLVFWGPASDDFFVLQIGDNGKVGVDRYLKTRWLLPLAYKDPPAEANVKPDAATELRVVTSGRKAQLYVNGAPLGTITGQTIKGDWMFGFFSQSGKSPAIAEFSSFVVRKPPPSSK